MQEALNDFMVNIFNQILQAEVKAIREHGFHNLSMTEIHLLEQVLKHPNATAGTIAEKLKVTPGTLTTALIPLEKKGYIARERSTTDKRMVHLIPTELAIEVSEIHDAFHQGMIDHVTNHLSNEELKGLVLGLESLAEYFINPPKKP